MHHLPRAYVHVPSLKKLHDNVARFIAAMHGIGP